MMRFGATEILLILVLALVLFGGKKLAGLGGALGKSIKDFRNEVQDVSDHSNSERVEKDSETELKEQKG